VIFKNRSTFTIFALVFFAIFLVALKTPMHSDDYSYYSRGLALDTHIANYMHWSGRVVADYVSTGMLFFDDFNIRALVNSLGVAFLIAIIASMPSAITKQKTRPEVLALVFFIYWVANPNIGQNAFWVVGTANYAFTTLFAFCYIYLFTKWIDNYNAKKIGALLLLGVIAGCSNENTSVTMAGLAFLASAYLMWQKRTSIAYATIPTAGVIIGALIIILAPGNYVRAKHPFFVEFGKLSIFEKVQIHLTQRIEFAFTSAWVVFLIAAVMLAFIVIKKPYKSDSQVKVLLALSAFFFMGFFVDNFVLFAAPYTPPRSYSSGFCFLMLSLSFLLSATVSSKDETDRKIALLAALTGIGFIVSYYLVYSSYSRTFTQNTLRISSVITERMKGEKIISVPTFHFARLLKGDDQFDRYHNEDSMGSYFGVTKIPSKIATFDYSGLASKPLWTGDVEVTEGINVTAIYASPQQPMIYGTLVFEFSKNADEIVNWTSDSKMFTHVYLKSGGSVTRDFSRLTIPLFGKYYGGVLMRGIDMNDIKSISFGYEVNGRAKTVFNVKM
jgi:hypothetical protein